MMSKASVYSLGLTKLAEDASAFMVNPLRAPTPQEATDMESYPKAAIMGLLGGGAAGTLLGALAKRNPASYGALGAGTGALAALVRHYDQSSDPPGLSPVYTVPSGLRLGALVGGGAGAAIGKATGFGMLPGLLAGAGSGSIGGALASGMV